MKQQNFLNNYNLRMLGIPAAAVTVMTLILSRGNFLAAIGAGIGTAVSVYVTNYRLIAKVKFLEEKILFPPDDGCSPDDWKRLQETLNPKNK